MIIVTGTGRSGTSFLARLFAAMGHKLGYGVMAKFHNWRDVNAAELQALSRSRDVVKDPFFCYTLGRWAESGAQINWVVVGFRPFREAAESAVKTGLAAPAVGDVDKTERAFRKRYERLICEIGIYELPWVEVAFPRSVRDKDYCWQSLKPVLSVPYETFSLAWDFAVDPESSPGEENAEGGLAEEHG
ncbi:MAG: hypothetical protein ACYSVY_19320 [Planctomycetota bacterium]